MCAPLCAIRTIQPGVTNLNKEVQTDTLTRIIAIIRKNIHSEAEEAKLVKRLNCNPYYQAIDSGAELYVTINGDNELNLGQTAAPGAF